LSCADCDRAGHSYASGCKECSARLLARSPAYFDSARDGSMTRTYRANLLYVFGAEGMTEGHERVKAWNERLRAAEKT
jgi:hypothetical protein